MSNNIPKLPLPNFTSYSFFLLHWTYLQDKKGMQNISENILYSVKIMSVEIRSNWQKVGFNYGRELKKPQKHSNRHSYTTQRMQLRVATGSNDAHRWLKES